MSHRFTVISLSLVLFQSWMIHRDWILYRFLCKIFKISIVVFLHKTKWKNYTINSFKKEQNRDIDNNSLWCNRFIELSSTYRSTLLVTQNRHSAAFVSLVRSRDAFSLFAHFRSNRPAINFSNVRGRTIKKKKNSERGNTFGAVCSEARSVVPDEIRKETETANRGENRREEGARRDEGGRTKRRRKRKDESAWKRRKPGVVNGAHRWEGKKSRGRGEGESWWGAREG